MTVKGKGVKRSRDWQCSWLGNLAGFFKFSKSAGKVRVRVRKKKPDFGAGTEEVRVRSKIWCGIWYGYGLHLAKEVR